MNILVGLVLVLCWWAYMRMSFGRKSIYRIQRWYAQRGVKEEVVSGDTRPAFALPIALITGVVVVLYALHTEQVAVIEQDWLIWCAYWLILFAVAIWEFKMCRQFIAGLRKLPIRQNDFSIISLGMPVLRPGDVHYDVFVLMYGILAVGMPIFIYYIVSM